MPEPRTLTVSYHAEPAIVFALRVARNQLEARARVAEQAGTRDGLDRAAWCRRQGEHLADLLEDLGIARKPARPDLAVVQEPGGTFGVRDGDVVRLVPLPDLEELIQRASDLASDRGGPDLAGVLEALAAATDQRPRDVLRQIAESRAVVRNETDPRLPDLETDLDFDGPLA